MAGGYQAVPDGLAYLRQLIDEIRSRLSELERPTGTSISSLVAQVQAKLAELDATVAALVADYVTDFSYDQGTIDSKIANPGNISPVNVTASGQVFSNAPLRSPGSHDYLVSTGYVAGWINSDGTVGTSPSTRALKKNLIRMDEADTPMGVDAVDALMGLTAYWGHYVWDDDGSPLKVFFIAEDVHEAGFGPDVAPLTDAGEPFTVNYSQMVVPLLAALQREHARGDAQQVEIDELRARLDALTA